MKVAFITPYYPSIRVSGGALYAYYLSHSLNKLVDLTIFLPDINSYKLDNELNYITIKVNEKPILKTMSFLYNVRKTMNLEEFDIIHVNENGGSFLKKIDVITFHHGPDTIKKRLYSLPIFWEAKKSSVIVTVSENSKCGLSNIRWLDKKRIEVVQNGINPKFFAKKDTKKN